MATKTLPKKPTPNRPASTPAKTRQTTLVPRSGAKKSSATNGVSNGKPKAKPNGSILTFFKKTEESTSNGLFLEERTPRQGTRHVENNTENVGWEDFPDDDTKDKDDDDSQERFNESRESVKRRRISADVLERACSPPPPNVSENKEDSVGLSSSIAKAQKAAKRVGPFLEDSDSEVDETSIERTTSLIPGFKTSGSSTSSSIKDVPMLSEDDAVEKYEKSDSCKLLLMKSESTNDTIVQDFEDFQDLEDEEFPEGEEYDERRWMEEQHRLEMAEGEFEDEPDDFDDLSPLNGILNRMEHITKDDTDLGGSNTSMCPLCSATLSGLSDSQASAHVNACLDGNPISLPKRKLSDRDRDPATANSKRFQRLVRPPKPGQQNPFTLANSTTEPNSAFSKLMANHAEDAAWAIAAASESASRGKPAYKRTCPFYKILPGFFICVDAFRYGAVQGCNGYFLSHFHSDHYVGLTASWCHGPIYCSRVTGNLVRQQLRVDPKWVVDLEFEKKTEVPGTEGVQVTMIPANHCPGSSLFLFEKVIGKGKNPKSQRVLHCGDFRACRAHVEHPLLRPDVIDAVGGRKGQQKLDVCYLDTTYLNPKYAFPAQEEVIKSCADMCISLNKDCTDDTDGWEQMKRERAGEGMVKFVRKGSEIKQEGSNNDVVDAVNITQTGNAKARGRLLVVVGTYSIGKERICLGIARALNSKIYAPPAKQRICAALEDAELNSRLTTDPREAQVHMTPLFEIRAETLDDYLNGFRDDFSRAVGFRPSGWNYRPPNSRSVESPSVQTVLHSQNWKNTYTMRELIPQRGSTSRASCFGVPYSEHSSFRELTMFCCALRIDKIIPTVNVGSAKSREKMKWWCEKWAVEKKKNGLFRLEEDGAVW